MLSLDREALVIKARFIPTSFPFEINFPVGRIENLSTFR